MRPCCNGPVAAAPHHRDSHSPTTRPRDQPSHVKFFSIRFASWTAKINDFFRCDSYLNPAQLHLEFQLIRLISKVSQ